VPAFGLFTNDPIEKDQVICEYKGVKSLSSLEPSASEFANDLIGNSYIFTVDQKNVIDGSQVGSLMRYANHGEGIQANCYSRIIFGKGSYNICLIANRDIEAGEELLFDYSF